MHTTATRTWLHSRTPHAVLAANYLAARIAEADAPCLCGDGGHPAGACLPAAAVCSWCGRGDSPILGAVQPHGMHGINCSVEAAAARSACPWCGEAGQLADLEEPCSACGWCGQCGPCGGLMPPAADSLYPAACSEPCRDEQAAELWEG